MESACNRFSIWASRERYPGAQRENGRPVVVDIYQAMTFFGESALCVSPQPGESAAMESTKIDDVVPARSRVCLSGPSLPWLSEVRRCDWLRSLEPGFTARIGTAPRRLGNADPVLRTARPDQHDGSVQMTFHAKLMRSMWARRARTITFS